MIHNFMEQLLWVDMHHSHPPYKPKATPPYLLLSQLLSGVQQPIHPVQF
jgi:hypothetical protein